MLQERASAVTDECVTQVQPGADAELLPDQTRLGLTTASSIPSANEPDQVNMQSDVMTAVYTHVTLLGEHSVDIQNLGVFIWIFSFHLIKFFGRKGQFWA